MEVLLKFIPVILLFVLGCGIMVDYDVYLKLEAFD